jgi:hypothetical protein
MDDQASARWLLRQRLLALAREMRHWKAVSRRNAPPRFWTHHSQIRAFALIVHNLSGAIYRNTHRKGFTAADARANARDVLALYRIWEFFRAKVAQRLDDRYAASLQLADEFAWACYRPAAAALYKEPPLVFLNGGQSPFILPRNRQYEAEFVPNELIHGEEYSEAMARLPFPVIGVPWYQVTMAWELPVIAHEVGHSIEGDLRLQKELRNRIDAAVPDPARRARWKGWCSEIFADFYGCRGVGPAFTSNLSDFLAGTASAHDDKYPPTSIRLLLNFAFLGVEFADQAAVLKQRIPALLNVETGYELYADPDVLRVAEQFRTLDVKLPPFSKPDYDAAYSLAQTALRGDRIDGIYDVRVVVAAVRIAYDAIIEKADVQQAPKYLERFQQLVEVLRRSAKPDIRAIGDESDAAARKAAHLSRAQDWRIG